MLGQLSKMRIFWTNIRVTDEGILYTKPDSCDMNKDNYWAIFQAVIQGKKIVPNEYIESLPGAIVPSNDNIGFIGGSCVIAVLDYRDTGLFIHELDNMVGHCRPVFEEVVSLIQRETKSEILAITQSEHRRKALTYQLKLPKNFLKLQKFTKRERTRYACCL